MDDFGTIWEGEYAFRKQTKSGSRKSSRSNRTSSTRMAPVDGDFDAVRSMEFSSSKTMMNREVPASSFKGSKGSPRTGDRYYYTNNVNNMYDEVFAATVSTIPLFEDVFNSSRMKLSELRDNDIFRAFRRIPGSSRVPYEDVFRDSPDHPSGLLMGSKVGRSSSRGSSSGRQSPAAHSGVVKRESTESSRSFRESPKTNNIAPDAALKIPVLGSFLSMSGTFSRQGPPDGPELSRSSGNSSQRKSEPEKQGSVKKEQMRTSKDWVTVGDVSLMTKSTENPPPARSAPALQEDMSESPTLETTREASGPPPVRVPPGVAKSNMPPEVKEPSHTRAHSLERILKDRSMQAGESVREKVLAWQMHSLVEQELDNPRRTMSLDRDRERIGDDVLHTEVTLFARLKAEVEQEAKHPFLVEPDHAGRGQESQVEEVEVVESGRGEEAEGSSHEQEHVQDQEQVAEVAPEAENSRPSGAVQADAEETDLLSSRTEDPEVALSSQTAEAGLFRSRPKVHRSGHESEPEVQRSSPTAEAEIVQSNHTAEPEVVPSSTADVLRSTDADAAEAEFLDVAETPRSSDAADREKSKSSEAAEAEKDPPLNDEAEGEIPRSSAAAENKPEDQKNEERSPQRRSTSSDKESSFGIDTISSISEEEQETKAKSTAETTELHQDPAPETPERLENSNSYKKSEKSSSEEAIENAWKEEARKTAEEEAQQRSLVARIQAEVRERQAAKMKAEKAAKEAMVKAKAVERRTRPRLKEAINNSNVGGGSTSRFSLREQLEMERQLRSSSGVEGGGKATLAEKITAEVRERARSVERSRAAVSRAEEQQLRQQQLQQQQLQQQLQQQQREMQRLQRERLERERLQEKERLEKIEKERLEKLQRERMERELEREREIEREKDRIGLEKKLNEEKARQEREAIAREQAAVAAAAAAAAERARMERAAVERATSEARARAERAAYEKSNRSSSVPRHSVSMPNTGTSQAAEAAAASIRRTTSTLNLDSQSSARDFQQKGETPERMKARLERNQRTMDRQARALAQKNQRDLEIQSEQAERQRLAERLDTDIKRWSLGKDGNIRALLSTLQYVLWPDSGWKQVSLTELISSAAVKKAYRRAALCVHPDKMQQKNATVQQKYIADKVFHILQVAWNKFNSQETL